MAIRVYIVEDHPLMRETLVAYLRLNSDIELCGVVESAEQATAGIEAADPSVVLVDLSLPGRSGLDLLKDIGDRWAYPCIVLSGHGEASYVVRALELGARGYILKGHPEELPAAIRRVASGDVYVSPSLRGEPGDAKTGA